MAATRIPALRCLLAAAFAAAACGTSAPASLALPGEAEPWPAGDAMFTRDPRWLGGDAVYSVDLRDGRILWLFGDSFVAVDGSADRRRSVMVRNTIALQQGADPARGEIAFHWRQREGGAPGAYFADDGVHGFWPLHGVRVPDGPLLLFQTIVRATPNEGLGFAIDGWRVMRCDDVRGEPAQWTWRNVACTPLAEGVTAGTSVWLDGGHVVALGTRFDGFVHRGVLCRFAIADLAGDRVSLQWWNGEAWSGNAPPAPAVVLDDAGPECSLHRSSGDGATWLHVWSRGFGATTVAMHTAAAPTGPWSAAHVVFTPPECARERPFVYAGKAHPELDAGDGWLAVSYATNSLQFADLFTPAGQAALYWPRFWRIRIR